MTTYLFVTDPEKWDIEAPGVPGGANWSCSKTTLSGDQVLVYLLEEGITHEWVAISDAKPCRQWRYCCDVSLVRRIKPPISIEDLRSLFPKGQWRALDQNFRGYRSIRIPPAVEQQLRASRRLKARTR